MNEGIEGGATTRVGNWNRPAHHQCAHVMESGVRCNASTATGKKLCHAHQRYGESDPLYPCQVPLLEDASSIRFVISQTSRQLAMGAIPPSNGRAMLYGCRMALDLLLFEQAQERRRVMEEKKLEAASQPVGGSASQPDTTVASEASVESHPSQNRAWMGHPGDVAGQPVRELAGERDSIAVERSGELVEICAACAEADDESELDAEAPSEAEAAPAQAPVPFVLRKEPRFAYLRREWDKAIDRGVREISPNRSPADDEDAEFWRERMNGPLQAGHPQTRQVHPCLRSAIAAGRSADASAYAEAIANPAQCGPSDLPFNPAFPTPSPDMHEWREEHIAAWYRCKIPTATEKQTRDYASHLYNVIQKNKAQGAAAGEAEKA